MTPYKSKKSFKTRLVIAISIVNLAVILAITYLTYRWNAQQLQEQTIAQTQQTIEQAGTNVSTYMDELYRLTLTPYRLQTGKEHNHIVAAHLPYTHDDQCRLAPRCTPSHMGTSFSPIAIRKLLIKPISGLKIQSQTILTATVEVMLGRNSATR